MYYKIYKIFFIYRKDFFFLVIFLVILLVILSNISSYIFDIRYSTKNLFYII